MKLESHDFAKVYILQQEFFFLNHKKLQYCEICDF